MDGGRWWGARVVDFCTMDLVMDLLANSLRVLRCRASTILPFKAQLINPQEIGKKNKRRPDARPWSSTSETHDLQRLKPDCPLAVYISRSWSVKIDVLDDVTAWAWWTAIGRVASVRPSPKIRWWSVTGRRRERERERERERKR